MAYGDGGRGFWVRGKGAWFLGGVASEEVGVACRWERVGRGTSGGRGLYGWGAWPLGERSRGVVSGGGAWLPRRRGRGLEMEAGWGGVKKAGAWLVGMGGVAYG